MFRFGRAVKFRPSDVLHLKADAAGSAQIGKTVIANIFLGGLMAMDPCDCLVVHPTDDNASRWSKLKLF
jgi:phage terminase large subunit GpA-like protein